VYVPALSICPICCSPPLQNYVVQFVLEHGHPKDKALVLSKLRGQMLQMARHKFASNVCEKALVTTDPMSRSILIDELITPRQDGLSPIVTMMKDQFASGCPNHISISIS
jgi:pumilio RNA-binding family